MTAISPSTAPGRGRVIDLRDRANVYVGKGTGIRCFAHFADARIWSI